MKRLYVLIPIVGFTLAGCEKPAANVENSGERSEPAQPLPPPPASSTSPAPAQKTSSEPVPAEAPKSEPEPPAKQLAPEGTLFVKDRVRVVTEEGIRAVNPGTHVKIVRKTDGGYVVADKHGEFSVEPTQVTNEVAAASGALATHRAETSADTAATQAQSQAAAERLLAQKQQAELNGQSAARQQRSRELDARHSALVREQAILEANIQQYQLEETRHNRATHVYGKLSTRSLDPKQKATWVARLSVLHEEKRNVLNEIDRLRYVR